MFDLRYEVHNWKNAIAILQGAYPQELFEIQQVLNGFNLLASDILYPGRDKSPIARKLDV